MDISVFTDKSIAPQISDLKTALGATEKLWHTVIRYVHQKYPAVIEEWKYPGAKYGWSFRLKDKKRVIIYLLPREGYFKAAVVFGQKACEEVMGSNVAKTIKDDLAAATPYAEGRGIRIDVKDENALKDIETLIGIKLAH